MKIKRPKVKRREREKNTYCIEEEPKSGVR